MAGKSTQRARAMIRAATDKAPAPKPTPQPAAAESRFQPKQVPPPAATPWRRVNMSSPRTRTGS
jgi:hypothetical protein